MGPIEYWSRVLGFKYLPRLEAAAPRLVVFDVPHANLGQQEIFQKMVAALGLRIDEVHVIEALPSDWTQLQVPLELPILCFSADWDVYLQEVRPEQSRVTVPSPAHLKTHPEQKKEAWAKMQKLIPRI